MGRDCIGGRVCRDSVQVRPAMTNPPVDESQTIVARAQVPPEVASILDRSCRDCHSNKTVWPWYTHVAPVSWWLADHVDHGRKDLNLSEWGKLPADRRIASYARFVTK